MVATDYVPALLDRARERAAAERLDLEFREADAEALPFQDGSFDVVVSTFGVMFTPDQERAAAEMLRVSPRRQDRPGQLDAGGLHRAGIQDDRQAYAATGRRQVTGAVGHRARLAELFGRKRLVRSAQRHFVFRYRSPEHWLDVFRTYYGPMLKAFAALGLKEQAALQRDSCRSPGVQSRRRRDDGRAERVPRGRDYAALRDTAFSDEGGEPRSTRGGLGMGV